MKQTKEEILKKYILLGQSELDSEKDNEFEGEDYKNTEKYLCRAMEEYATQCQEDMADDSLSDEVLFEQATVAMEEHYGYGCETEIDAYFRGLKWMQKQLNK